MGHSVSPQCWQAARDFAERLRQRWGPRVREVRIFGSQARGQARPGSDLDLFVLVDDEDWALRWEIAGISDEVMAAFNYEVVPSPLVMDHSEFQALQARERRLARDILTEGISVLP